MSPQKAPLVVPRVLRAVVAISLVAGCNSVVLSGYGTRVGVSRNEDGSVRGRNVPHQGVDFKAWAVGDPVLAAAYGEVRRVSFMDCSGVEVLVEHPDFNRYTLYVHLRQARVRPGQLVKRGEVIGEVGLYRCSGEVVHVHMELRWLKKRARYRRVPYELVGTEDPLTHAAGCFDSTKQYPSDRLVLTYPVRC